MKKINLKDIRKKVTAHGKNLSSKARMHHKKIHKHIKKKISQNIPTNGEHIGKAIEKKLTASQKVWSNVGVAFFGQKALENISHFSSYLLGALMIILTDIVLIFPTDAQSLAPRAMLLNFAIVLAGILIINAATYTAMRLLGSKTRFKVFFSTVNTALFMSLLVFAIPIALISFAIFSTMLRSQSAINLFFSIIPFYNYLIYGWSSEAIAKIKGAKSIAVALIALLLVLLFNLTLQSLLV